MDHNLDTDRLRHLIFRNDLNNNNLEYQSTNNDDIESSSNTHRIRSNDYLRIDEMKNVLKSPTISLKLDSARSINSHKELFDYTNRFQQTNKNFILTDPGIFLDDNESLMQSPLKSNNSSNNLDRMYRNTIVKQIQYDLDINEHIFQILLDINRYESNAEDKPFFNILLEDTYTILSNRTLKNISFISNTIPFNNKKIKNNNNNNGSSGNGVNGSNGCSNHFVSTNANSYYNGSHHININSNGYDTHRASGYDNRYYIDLDDCIETNFNEITTVKSKNLQTFHNNILNKNYATPKKSPNKKKLTTPNLYNNKCNITVNNQNSKQIMNFNDDNNDDNDDYDEDNIDLDGDDIDEMKNIEINHHNVKDKKKSVPFEFYNKRLDYVDILNILSSILRTQDIMLLFNSSNNYNNQIISNDEYLCKIQDIHLLSTNLNFKKFIITINYSVSNNQTTPLHNGHISQEKLLRDLKNEIYNCLSPYINKFVPDDIHIINIKSQLNRTTIIMQLGKIFAHQYKICLYLLKKHLSNIIDDIKLSRCIQYIQISPDDILLQKVHIYKQEIKQTRPSKNMHTVQNNINTPRTTSNSCSNSRSGICHISINNNSHTDQNLKKNDHRSSIFAPNTLDILSIKSYQPDQGWILYPLLHQEMQVENWMIGYISASGYGQIAQLKAGQLFRGSTCKNRRSLLLESIMREDIGPNRYRLASMNTNRSGVGVNVSDTLNKLCGVGILVLNQIAVNIDKQLYTCARVARVCQKGINCDKVWNINRNTEGNGDIPMSDLIKNLNIYANSIGSNPKIEANMQGITTKKPNEKNPINNNLTCNHDQIPYLITIQVKVRSDMIRIPDKCDGSLWVINDPIFIKPVGILIKEITLNEAKAFEENHVVI